MATASPGSTVQERALLEGARRGQDYAFGRLVGPYWPELHAHCYRLLGSVHDADDALQDALLRAWRGLPGFDSRRPLHPWHTMSNARPWNWLSLRRCSICPASSAPY